MKRFLFVIVSIVLSIVGLAPASTASSTVDSPPPGNVFVSLYLDKGVYKQTAYRFDPSPEDPYQFSPCGPNECGKIVFKTIKKHGKKVKVAIYKPAPGERVLDGYQYHYNPKLRFGTTADWNGKKTPVKYRAIMPSGKKIKVRLNTLNLSISSPRFETPVYDNVGSK